MASPARFGPRDLLEYDSRYGVLICRECQYAIQKSAVDSHLLRHKIYRDERHRLLSLIAHLDLLEPDLVPFPASADPPIDALPIISGYHCTAAGCGHLCASDIRMRRHQSKVHGLNEALTSAFFVRPAKLQTFFRGTKIRYFEVTPSPALWHRSAHDNAQSDDNEGSNEGMPDTDTVSAPPPPVPPPPNEIPTATGDLNLETLTYFHQFMTATSFTLPNNHRQSELHYWQTDVVRLALQRKWLMYGLLAISACHLATVTSDAMTKQLHRERSIQLFSEFELRFNEPTQSETSVAAVDSQEVKNIGRKIESFVRCAHWALAEWWLDRDAISTQAVASKLRAIVKIFQDLVDRECTTDSGRPWSDENRDPQETFAQTSRILRMRSSPHNVGSNVYSSSGDAPSMLFNRLAALPSRMTKAFGRPETSEDVEAVMVTLSAIARLIECCDISFVSEEIGTAFEAMAAWWAKVPSHFNVLLSCNNPAALVVLAHWTMSLVKRAEECGCWFLNGAAMAILRLVQYLLPVDNLAMHRLVADLFP